MEIFTVLSRWVISNDDVVHRIALHEKTGEFLSAFSMKWVAAVSLYVFLSCYCICHKHKMRYIFVHPLDIHWVDRASFVCSIIMMQHNGLLHNLPRQWIYSYICLHVWWVVLHAVFFCEMLDPMCEATSTILDFWLFKNRQLVTYVCTSMA